MDDAEFRRYRFKFLLIHITTVSSSRGIPQFSSGAVRREGEGGINSVSERVSVQRSPVDGDFNRLSSDSRQ
jgi:hypothetical protein